MALAKTVKKSFGNEREREREGRTMNGIEGEREREREAHQQATRGSNLPGRRDFASEAGANC